MNNNNNNNILILNPILTLLPVSVQVQVVQHGIIDTMQWYQAMVEQQESVEEEPPSAPEDPMLHGLLHVPNMAYMIDPPRHDNLDNLRYVRNVLAVSFASWVGSVVRPQKDETKTKKKIAREVPAEPVYVDVTDCPVCLSSRVRVFQQTNCGHAFCQGCAKKHFGQHTACPMCRTEVVTLRRVEKRREGTQEVV
jgi:hypothetical protein